MTDPAANTSSQPSFYGIGGIILLCLAIVLSFQLVVAVHGFFAKSGPSWYDPPVSLLLVNCLAGCP